MSGARFAGGSVRATKERVHVQRLGDVPPSRRFAGNDLLHSLMSLDLRRLDRQTRHVRRLIDRVQFHLATGEIPRVPFCTMILPKIVRGTNFFTDFYGENEGM